MNLHSIDLNLLVALDALLAECHVTRAAERLGLSQPGMSNALARLRVLLDDPVLVRTAHGMAPTRRAQELVGPVRRALQEIEQALAPQEFDPAEATTRFRVGSTDYTEFVLLGELARTLEERAPRARLQVVPLEPYPPVELLNRSDADLVVGYQPGGDPDCHWQPLFSETFMCVVRKDHPRVKDELTLETYAELPHVLTSVRGDPRGFVDDLLEKRGLRRHIAVCTPHFLNVPTIIMQTDYIATMTARAARAMARRLPVAVFTPPLPVPSFEVRQFWHERTHYDPAHRWLRERVAEVARVVAERA